MTTKLRTLNSCQRGNDIRRLSYLRERTHGVPKLMELNLDAIRYFLAIVETMNFTRAAEYCCVRQPSLTRAIGKLEAQLDGKLFNRERNHTHLTELGRLMLPHLKQCHDSAAQVKDLAREKRQGSCHILKLGISNTVPMRLISGCLAELKQQHSELGIEYLRGNTGDIIKALGTGKVELAIAGPTVINRHDRPRLDCWSLFEEDFALAVSNSNLCAELASVELSDLCEMTILVRPWCERHADLAELFAHADISIDKAPVVRRDDDLIPLVRADLGVCVIPRSLGTGYGFKMIPIRDCGLSRRLNLYAAPDKKRTAAGVALAGLLASHDWGNIAGRRSEGGGVNEHPTARHVSHRWQTAG